MSPGFRPALFSLSVILRTFYDYSLRRIETVFFCNSRVIFHDGYSQHLPAHFINPRQRKSYAALSAYSVWLLSLKTDQRNAILCSVGRKNGIK